MGRLGLLRKRQWTSVFFWRVMRCFGRKLSRMLWRFRRSFRSIFGGGVTDGRPRLRDKSSDSVSHTSKT